MNQHLLAAIERNPGAEITTFTRPFQVRHKGRQLHVVAELRRIDGSLIETAVGPTKPIAIENLDTRLSLR